MQWFKGIKYPVSIYRDDFWKGQQLYKHTGTPDSVSTVSWYKFSTPLSAVRKPALPIPWTAVKTE